MYNAIAVASASSTHCTSAWSIMEPGGGAPGRIFRSGTIANRFAAYQVANGGTNFRLPIAIGMATTSARVGRLTKTRMMPRSKISGPLARCSVTTTLLVLWLPVSLVSLLRVTLAFGAIPDEDVRRDRLGLIRVKWPGAGITVRLDRGTDLGRRLACGVFQITQIVGWIQPHCDIGVQLIEAFVLQGLARIDEHVHREAIRRGLQLLEPNLHHGLIGAGLADVQRRKWTL